ncbi:MAG TPA: histidine kinase N-terminal 7TM domain-containing protein, partial [Rectinemataceae bacterium]|nr:histidine kinase N-terminal 7TM domain-containing protein [Rectinemataceae bacterium]
MLSFIDAYTAALIAVAILSLFLASRAFSWPANGAREFGCIQIGIAVYAIGYVAELSSTSLLGAMRAVRFEFLGIAALLIAWVLFALRFSGRSRIRPALVALISFLPACTVVMVWTDPLHHLFYA